MDDGAPWTKAEGLFTGCVILGMGLYSLNLVNNSVTAVIIKVECC